VITLLPSSTAVTIPVLLTVALPGFADTQLAEPVLSTVAPSENATKALSCAVSPFLVNSELPATRRVIGAGPAAGLTGVSDEEEEEPLHAVAVSATRIPRMVCLTAVTAARDGPLPQLSHAQLRHSWKRDALSLVSSHFGAAATICVAVGFRGIRPDGALYNGKKQ